MPLHPRLIPYKTVSIKELMKTELRSESVRFKNVNFRCCQQLKKTLKTMPLTRMKSSGRRAPGMADREELLFRYLDENSYITVRSYRYLTGLSDYSARKDLSALVASGRLVKGGSRLFAIYTLPKEDAGASQPLIVDSNLPG